MTWGERFARVELELDGRAAGPQAVEAGFAPGQGKRMRWNGVDVASLEDLRGRSQVFIFVPESLLLVKGSPARRRAHLDTFAAALDPAYAAAARDAQTALRQRNAQLYAVKNGAAEAALDPWDVQFARAAVELGRRRRDLVAELAGALRRRRRRPCAGGPDLHRATRDPTRRRRLRRRVARGGVAAPPAGRDHPRPVAVRPAPRRPAFPRVAADGAGRQPAAAERLRGRRRRRSDPEVVLPSGPVCGPVDLPKGGRDLRLFGSQGEQRAAVLALLLAEQRLAASRTGEQGTLFLDDVMSELDDARRRLLVRRLASAGQSIITTTNRHYFTEDELAAGHRHRVAPGRVAGPAAGASAGRRGHAGAARDGCAVSAGSRRKPDPPESPGRGALPVRLGDILNPALDRLATSEQARAYAAWARASGDQVASGARPRHFAPRRAHRGVLLFGVGQRAHVPQRCSSCRRMDEVAPGHPVKRFRFVIETGRAGRKKSLPRRREGLSRRPTRRPISRRRGSRRRECVTSGSGRPSRPRCAQRRGKPVTLPATAPRMVDKNHPFAAISCTARGRPQPQVLIYSGRQVLPASRTPVLPLGILRG